MPPQNVQFGGMRDTLPSSSSLVGKCWQTYMSMRCMRQWAGRAAAAAVAEWMAAAATAAAAAGEWTGQGAWWRPLCCCRRPRRPPSHPQPIVASTK